MNESLLKPEIQAFIDQNIGVDVAKLAFTKNPFPEVDFREILGQISAKTKAKEKLPSWFKTDGIVYPSKVSVEQTSSEKTADYKSKIVSGKTLIDLTGGFGVDDYYFSKQFENVLHCEMNPELSDIAKHNFGQLDAQNISCESGDSLDALKRSDRKFDVIYIDPSRRNDQKGKVFLLKDCEPNVPELLDMYFGFSDVVLIKTAPILDISAAVSELKYVKEIHVVAVENEVKELLFLIEKGFEHEFSITSVNILKDSVQKFKVDKNGTVETTPFGLPSHYLYEPNAAIMKAGIIDEAGTGLVKLHPNSHLFTSGKLHDDFQGRIFAIQRCFAYEKKAMKEFLQGKKANVTIRNFPDTVENLRKKWKIADGGNVYCFFSTAFPNDKIVLLCAKI